MKLSVVIPTYNGLSFSQACLASLRATVPAGLAHEIILIDDGSTDGTRDWLAKLTLSSSNGLATLAPPVRVLLNERNLGFAATCNRGGAAAQGEFLVFLNNDLVLLPGWLEPMLDVFGRRADAGLVGNIQRNAATGAIDHTGLFFNYKGKPEHSRFRPPWVRRCVPALTGACFAIRRAVWRQFGGFDETFVNGCEDVDLCLRAQAAGRRNYVAMCSVVLHHISQSPGRNLRNEHNTWRLVTRWRDTIARLAARDWCRHYIATHWDQSFVFDDALGRAALFYYLGLHRAPPPGLLARVQTALALELEHWARLLDAKV